jgi:hypothetical protein
MCGAFKKFDGHQAELPLDQHLLIAFIAPRPVYVASAADDLWPDAKDKFLAAKRLHPSMRSLAFPDSLALRFGRLRCECS